MALHDYWCRTCGTILPDVYRSAAEGAQSRPPLHCGAPTVWLPGTTAMDVGGVKTAAFRAFDTTDGRGRPVRIDSLHKLRQVEKESEQMARNGEGQPMVFRHWAQDRSNRDRPTLTKDYQGGEQPTAAAARRFGPTLRKAAEAPEVALGPGVREEHASALGMGD